LSFSGIDLLPGDSLEFAFVIAMGEKFHRNPTDFANLYDSQHPERLYDSFDFSDLIHNVLTARQLYQSAFQRASGDIDGDQKVDLADVMRLLDYLYYDSDPPYPFYAADLNADCAVDLRDLVAIVRYLYREGTAPVSGCRE
jgi:hypothetical protein